MRPKTATKAQRISATKTRAIPHQMLNIRGPSSRRCVHSGPLGEGQNRASDPPPESGDEEQERQCRVKTDTLEDLPARIDDDQRHNDVIEQAVMEHCFPPWWVFGVPGCDRKPRQPLSRACARAKAGRATIRCT